MSRQVEGTQSQPQAATDCSQLLDGNASATCPLGPMYEWLENPINRRRKVLTEDWFVYLFLHSGLKWTDAKLRYGIANNVYVTSKKQYGEKYKEQLRAIKHEHYSTALKGNTHGAKRHPGTLVNKDVLSELVIQGWRIPEIARRFGISEWFVRENIRYYGLAQTAKLPYRLRETDMLYLQQLEFFYPGIVEKARTFYNDPYAYFDAVYQAWCRMQNLIWFVKEHARWHGHYVSEGKIAKNHICWLSNRYEQLLSLALLDAGIQHERQFFVAGNQFVDFRITNTNVCIEVDGERHARDLATKQRDRRKHRKMQARGFTIIRVFNHDVLFHIDEVVRRIKLAIATQL